MPKISPSLASNRSVTAWAIRGLRKVVAMNLPLPSGSSPPEKPPGSMTIWARRMAASIRAMVSSIWAGARFLTTRISVSAPARWKALALSASQLVPGNTGINTLGRAVLIAGARRSRSFHRGTSAMGPAGRAQLGKTPSRVPFQAAINSSMAIRSPSRRT